jgi:glutamate dehydrogenase/leucine dehydrogenase
MAISPLRSQRAKDRYRQHSTVPAHARIVAQAAKGPLTPAVDKILEKKDDFVNPDILCNVGGAAVFYTALLLRTLR